MAVPDIRSLSAYDLNKIQQSLSQYKATQGDYRNSPMYDPNQRGLKSQFDRDKREAAATRSPFQSGSSYGIEDEYRYMVSQGFKPQAAQPAQPAAAEPVASQQQPQQYKPEQLKVKSQEPVEKGPTAADLAVERLTDQISKMQSDYTAGLERQAKMFAEQAAEQEKRMSDLQQQMIQSTVMAAERPKTVGVKAATGTAGTLMSIARRGATGAFGRGGMRISSLNV